MIYGEAATTVSASPAEVLDFVCDLHRYRQADHKIGQVLSVETIGEDLVARFRTRVRGLPGPTARQRIHRSGDHRLDITNMPSWQDRLMTFHGFVTCEQTPDGTLVTHREQFDFHGPLRRVAEALLRDWLATDVSEEVARMNALLSPSGQPESTD